MREIPENSVPDRRPLERAYHSEHYGDAIELWTHALEFGVNEIWHYYRGRSQRHLGNSEAAIGDFDEVIRLHPRSFDAHLYRGKARM